MTNRRLNVFALFLFISYGLIALSPIPIQPVAAGGALQDCSSLCSSWDYAYCAPCCSDGEIYNCWATAFADYDAFYDYCVANNDVCVAGCDPSDSVCLSICNTGESDCMDLASSVLGDDESLCMEMQSCECI